MKLNKWDVIKIWWVDSMQEHGWTTFDDAEGKEKEMFQQSVGYLLEETPNSIHICHSASYNQKEVGVCGVIGIPKVAITKVEIIEKEPFNANRT